MKQSMNQIRTYKEHNCVKIAVFVCLTPEITFFLYFSNFLHHHPDSKGNMLNGQMGQRVRERIPTPENDNRLNGHNNNNNPFSNIQSIATGVALTAQTLATNPSIFPSSNNVPILGTLLLSPIKESDSVNNTLSSGSLAPSKSILPLSLKTTNTQFGSLVMQSGSNQDQEISTTNSFVVLPSSTHENEIIPMSITTVPMTMTISSHSASSGAVITELPMDQPDSSMGLRSGSATPHLGKLFADSPAVKHKIQRQQSVESNRSATADNASNVSASSNSTLSKRPAGPGNKHSEVYV